jgi:hypothetical protein
LPSVFSSTYDEYAIIFSGETFGNGRLDAQFYKSGSYVTASVYDLKTLYMANTSPNFLTTSSQEALNLVYGPNQQNSTYTGTIVHVNSTDDIQVPTIYGVGTARNYISQNSTKMDNASYRGPVNGIRVMCNRGYGTLSGTLRIYGIDKG